MSQICLKPLPRLATLICLILALAFSLSLQSAEAQAPGNHTVYLPLVIKSGTPSPTGPYAQILQKVQQTCPAVGLNQVCYVNGQITLQPKTGQIDFSKPGAIVDLANVQSLSLTSNGTDPQKWSLALLRLHANSITPDQGLTILAFGNVQLSDILLFTGPASLEAEGTLPSLQFASSPVAGVTKLGSSGLFVTNPSEEELLSLTLNGAALTLGSSALVEAKPGSQMTVTMGTGTSLTEAGGGSSTAIQSHQISIPLAQDGKVAGTPTQATIIDPLEFIFSDFVPLWTEERLKLLGTEVLRRLNRSIDRCVQGQTAYIYHVLFWAYNIEANLTDARLKDGIDPAKLAQAYERARNCLSFEVDFDSTVTTRATGLAEASHLNTTHLSLIFKPDGTLFLGVGAPLAYPSYSYTLTAGGCPITTETTSGQLQAIDGSLKVTGNKVRISTTILVVKRPTDKAIHNCPPPVGPRLISQNHWVTVFYHIHEDLLQSDLASFRFKDWKYTGGEHFGEAIYERTRTESGFTFDTTTYLIMVHTPLK